MKIPTPQEIQAIIDSLPQDIPLQNPGIQMLIGIMSENNIEMQPAHYPLRFAALAAVTTAAPQTVKVDSSAPFMLVQQQYWCAPSPVTVMTAATRIIPNATVLITDLQSGRNWQDAAVPVPTIFGTGENPWFYPQPRLIAANANLSVVTANYDTAQTIDLYLTFSGYRFYSSAK